MSVKESMFEFLQKHGHEGYFLSELETKFYSDVEDDPELLYIIPFGLQKNNIIAWKTPKKEFSNDIHELGKDKKIFLESHTNPLLWLSSGKILCLPIAKKYKQYKTEHWMPCFVKIPSKQDLDELVDD
jgi:hypothetical protein